MRHKVNAIHFVGIGGVGMSGIAEVLINLGFIISGSDVTDTTTVKRLINLGVNVSIGHHAKNIEGVDVLVTSTAIMSSNPEVVEAKKQGIPVVPRAVMLAELMRFKRGIAIAGTHGKTTTTSLVASILAEAGMDPTYVIGGRLESVGTNAKLGQGELIVAEADESDASFLYLQPELCVVTNIDKDHLEAYENDFGRLKQAFIDFVNRIPFYGLAVMCYDDIGVREILPTLAARHVITYGFDEGAMVRAKGSEIVDGMMRFAVERDLIGKPEPLIVKVNCLGEHNVLNSLAAISIASELGIDDQFIVRALGSFQGVGRRLQAFGDVSFKNKTCKLFDDYGHHPTEVMHTIAALRMAFPVGRLVLIYQPHRYSRTENCFDEFVQVLGEVDVLLLMDIYAAGEEPIPGIDSSALAKSIRTTSQVNPLCVHTFTEVSDVLPNVVLDGDIIVTMGAGSIGSLAKKLLLESAGGSI